MEKQIYYAATASCSIGKLRDKMCAKGYRGFKDLRKNIRAAAKQYAYCIYYIWTVDSIGQAIVEKQEWEGDHFINERNNRLKYQTV